MGIISFKSLNEGEHCHRLYKNGEKSIIICKNINCIDHICGFHDCKKNKYFRYWKYDNTGNKTHIEYCKSKCLCHLTKCIVLNKCNDNINRKVSDDVYADPLPLICHRCHSNDDNHHNFDFNFDD